MRIVDTIISREGGNSAWANVVFVGDSGETVSVRLPCPVPYGGQIGRSRIIKRAMKILLGLVSAETPGMPGESRTAAQVGRFGVAPETVSVPRETWRDMSSGED